MSHPNFELVKRNEIAAFPSIITTCRAIAEIQQHIKYLLNPSLFLVSVQNNSLTNE